MPLIVAVLLILPPPQTSLWDGWHTRIDVNHGLTVELLADYATLHDVLAETRTGIGVERWRPLVAKWWPPGEVSDAMCILKHESGGNPNAKNKHSSAAGLFQFLEGTWDWVAEHTGSPSYREGGPYDPVWSIRNAAWLQKHAGWGQWTTANRC